MNREIRFRAWDTFQEKMIDQPYWFRPNVDRNHEDVRFNSGWEYFETWQDVDDGVNRPCEIMELTGLKDKHGRDIFEGDLIGLRKRTYMGRVICWPVVFHEGAFCIQQGKNKPHRPTKSFWRNHEIIGNIYEHKHLLKN